MPAPVVSVVIPTYNQSSLLLETLESVFAQTYTDYEIIVVNDGSTDDTLARLGALGDRIRLIDRPNGGIGTARNHGIDEARGRYVALLDHDDLWLPDKLAVQVAFLDAHPECSLVSVPWAFSTAPGVCRFDLDGVRDAAGIVSRPLAHLAHGQFVVISSSMMFVRAKAAGLRYETIPRCPEDVTFQVGLFSRGAFGMAGDRILMIYRVHAGSYSAHADYLANGVSLLRRSLRENRFPELDAQGRRDLDLYVEHLARMSVVSALEGGRRAQALRLYGRDLARQAARRRVRFLVFFWVLLCLPTAAVRAYRGRQIARTGKIS